jgi:hypothetical protein
MTILLGYVGPGAGLGFLGSLLAVLAVIVIGLLGLVLYPLKLVIAWYRSQKTSKQSFETRLPKQSLGIMR